MRRTRITRVSIELDEIIRDIANKNRISHVEASKRIAKSQQQLNNRRVFDDIKF